MTNVWRSALRTLLASSTLTVLAACERANQPSSRTDTTLPPSVGAVESLPAAEPTRRWENSAGTVLLVRDDSLTRVIYPTVRQLDSTAVLDEALVRGFVAEAMAADGAAGSIRVRGFSPIDEECAVWPAVVLSTDSARDWSVAFQRGVSTPIALRPIVSLASADSARLAALLTRLAALGIAVVMVGAAVKVHLPNGFFMNWDLTPNKGHGFETNLALLAMALACVIAGGGALSIDRLLIH